MFSRHAFLMAGMALWFGGCNPKPTGPLFPAPMNGRMGYIDVKGQSVIPAHFDNARPFSEGLAAVSKDGRWGYIDRSGEFVIAPLFRSALDFHDGTAIVNSGLPDHPFGLINSTGAWIVSPSFRSLAPGDDTGRCYIGQKEPGSSFFFYDRSGNPLWGPFSSAFPFSEGWARVNEGGDAVLNSSGAVLLRGTIFDSTHFSEGVIAVHRDRKLGYMDASGALVIEPRYDEGGDFKEGLAPVQSEGHWMWINHSGAITAEFPAGVAHASPLSEGLSLVTADREGGLRGLGYVDRNGHWVIHPIWDDAEPFENGLARVGKFRDQTTVYIDPSGRIVWEGR